MFILAFSSSEMFCAIDKPNGSKCSMLLGHGKWLHVCLVFVSSRKFPELGITLKIFFQSYKESESLLNVATSAKCSLEYKKLHLASILDIFSPLDVYVF